MHIDMDCFYAAIEVRDRPELRGKPLGVGGSSGRGVLTTANYEARQFGCRSAMPAFMARQLCPDIILVPTRFEVYREASQQVHEVFRRYTSVIEPLSLDEAYLDLSHRAEGGAALAQEIREAIFERTGLTASAGIAPNKLLAKVASDWNKPNGQLEIRPEEVAGFMRGLRVSKLHGVGKVGRKELEELGVVTCGDLQQFSKVELGNRFGKWGLELFQRCRGRDERPVKVERTRKSLSKERTFSENVDSVEGLEPILGRLLPMVKEAVAQKVEMPIKSRVLKLKFADFTRTTAEKAGAEMDEETYLELLKVAWKRGGGKSVRLLGVGVRFEVEGDDQLELL